MPSQQSRPYRFSALQLTVGLMLPAVLLTAFASNDTRWYWVTNLAPAQPWRYLSAHLVHLTTWHLLANALPALVLAYSIDRLGLRNRLPAALALIVLSVGVGLEVAAWPLSWYAGASAALHGVFAWICCAILCWQIPRPTKTLHLGAMALLTAGLAKVCSGLEIPAGTQGWLGIPQATPAHFYGYCGGLLAGFLLRPK